jgi:hypothetical protein
VTLRCDPYPVAELTQAFTIVIDSPASKPFPRFSAPAQHLCFIHFPPPESASTAVSNPRPECGRRVNLE